jgi:hypothetical protein
MPSDVTASPAAKPAGPLTIAAPGAASLAVLADFLADRFGAQQEVADLVAAGQVPHATLSMGKSPFDESDPGLCRDLRRCRPGPDRSQTPQAGRAGIPRRAGELS